MIKQLLRRRLARNYEDPMRDGSRNQWVIPAEVDPIDKRTCAELIVSYGYMTNNRYRKVSLRIDDKVVVLEPLHANALLALLIRAAD